MKKKQTSLDTVNSETIKQFLSQCLESEHPSLPQVDDIGMQKALQSIWESNVALSNTAEQEPATILAQMQNEAYVLQTSCLVKDIILNPTIDIEILKAIKDEYKHRTKTSSSQEEKQLVTVVYYSAIAGALVNHHTKITSCSNEQINNAIVQFMKLNWLLPEIKELFEKANIITGSCDDK